MNPLDTTKRQVLFSTSQLRDSCLRSSCDFPQNPEHCSPTKYARVSICSHGDAIMLFCLSFTQSERVFQTDRFIIRLRSCSHFKLHSHVDERRARARAQVRCSDLVGSDLPHLLHLSKSESFAMRCSRRCNLCEALSNLLTVSPCTFKIRCPGSIAQTCIKVTFVSTWRVRRLAPLRFRNPRAAELSEQSSQVSICAICSFGLSLRFPRKLHQPVPSARIHQNSNEPCSACRKTGTMDTTCFQQNFLPKLRS